MKRFLRLIHRCLASRIVLPKFRPTTRWEQVGLVLLFFVFAVVVFLTPVFLRILVYRSSIPQGETLADVLEVQPHPRQIVVFGHKERDHLWLEGPMWLIPGTSGPPVYIIDDQGKLVDWTFDVGDDEEFKERFGGLGPPSEQRVLTLSELMNWPGATREKHVIPQ